MVAYPGENGLAITKVIYDAQERIVVGDIDDMEELQEELVEVSALMPKSSPPRPSSQPKRVLASGIASAVFDGR